MVRWRHLVATFYSPLSSWIRTSLHPRARREIVRCGVRSRSCCSCTMAASKREASNVPSRLKQKVSTDPPKFPGVRTARRHDVCVLTWSAVQVASHAEIQRKRVDNVKALVCTRWEVPALDIHHVKHRKRQRQVSEEEKANRAMQARLDAIYQRDTPHYQVDYDADLRRARAHLQQLRLNSRARQQSFVVRNYQIYKERLSSVKAYYAGTQRRPSKSRPATSHQATPQRRRPQSAGSVDVVLDCMLDAPRSTSPKTATSARARSMLHLPRKHFLTSPFIGASCVVSPESSTSSNCGGSVSTKRGIHGKARPRSAPAAGKELLRPTTRLPLSLLSCSAAGSHASKQMSSSASSAREKLLLASRTVPMLGEDKNCVLHIYAMPGDYESLFIEVYSSSEAKTLLGERVLPIDDVFTFMDEHLYDNGTDDSQSTAVMLMNIFKAADIDNNGKLSYREFRRLMQQANLGLSDPELQLLLSEADETHSGMIKYSEFVPLAVDMLNAFRARNRARRLRTRAENAVDDQVLALLSSEEVDQIYSIVLPLCKDRDRDDMGNIRIDELKEILRSSRVGLTPVEVNVVVKSMRRDSLGNVPYKAELHSTLKQAKFTMLQNAIMESQSSDIERHLMKECEAEERRSLHQPEATELRGWITVAALMNVLLSSSRLPLTRLQAIILLRDAESVDGLVDYRGFVPTAAKAIEMMFSPSVLKQRASLIASADLSAETMLKGKSSPAFQKRLKVLFRSYDVDHNGELDYFEFRSCLLSLDLGLSDIEIEALMASADRDGNGTVNLEEFAHFCANKLVELEREKHIRSLQSTFARASSTPDTSSLGSTDKLNQQLKSIFLAADRDGSGTLNVSEITDVFAALDISVSPFQLAVLVSEMDENDDGVIEYEEFIPICAELLRAYQQDGQHGSVHPGYDKHVVDKQVEALLGAEQAEIERIVSGLIRICKAADFNGSGKLPRREFASILRRPVSMLSRTEANQIVAAMSGQAGSQNGMIQYEGLLPCYLDARRTTFKRNLMARKDIARFEQQFLESCDAAFHAQAGSQSPSVDRMPRTLSASGIYSILRAGVGPIRLTSSQILVLLSTFDYQGRSDGEVDYHAFAQHAAEMVDSFYQPHTIERLSAVVAQAQLKPNDVLVGVGEKAIYDYCVRAFTGVAQQCNLASHEAAAEVLATLPRIRLSPREIQVLLATAPTLDGQILWPDFVEQLYHMLYQLLRDRKVHRRLTVSLAEISGSSSELGPLKQVAEELVDLLEVARVKSVVQVVLPKRDKTVPDAAADLQTKADQQNVEYVRQEPVLYRRRSTLPPPRPAIKMMPETLNEAEKRGANCVATHGKLVLVKGTELQVPMIVQVFLSGEHHDHEQQLELHAVSVDGSIEVLNGTPILLPSICTADQETAKEYVANMVDHLILIKTESGRFDFEIRQW